MSNKNFRFCSPHHDASPKTADHHRFTRVTVFLTPVLLSFCVLQEGKMYINFKSIWPIDQIDLANWKTKRRDLVTLQNTKSEH